MIWHSPPGNLPLLIEVYAEAGNILEVIVARPLDVVAGKIVQEWDAGTHIIVVMEVPKDEQGER